MLQFVNQESKTEQSYVAICSLRIEHGVIAFCNVRIEYGAIAFCNLQFKKKHGAIACSNLRIEHIGNRCLTYEQKMRWSDLCNLGIRRIRKKLHGPIFNLKKRLCENGICDLRIDDEGNCMVKIAICNLRIKIKHKSFYLSTIDNH